MLKKEEFIRYILEGPKTLQKNETQQGTSALPEGFEDFGFDTEAVQDSPVDTRASFTQRLLEASNFGYPDSVQTKDLIRSDDAVVRYLPVRASYWPKVPTRPYQTLLFEADITHKDILGIPAFKNRKMSHLDIVEDALARMVSEALDGFQRGGEGVTSDVRQGQKDETLCIISIMDERDQEPVRLVCFGTQNASTGGLETFHITEQTRFWDQSLARDHLGLLYERQFKKLAGKSWQEAFTTTEERKQAEKLLEVCSKKAPTEKDIQAHVLNLLDTIAKGFGLRCRQGQTHRLQAYALPSDHDIGIDPEEMDAKHGGKNPFGGVMLRDENNRLLGYIVYPLKTKKDAETLRSYLAKNNRFHNVLVVFPDGDETTLELWQGKEPLAGKLRKGNRFEGAAEVVNLLSRFFIVSKAKVRNPAELAQELAYRARYLRRLALKELEAEKKEGPLRDLYNAFKEALVHDQTEDEFADAFAQTITNGMLNARWIGNDRIKAGGNRFTRQNALQYMPTTNPFLHDLFHSVLGVKMDDQRGRFLWLVDDIADLLDRVDVVYVFGIGDAGGDPASDPVIHFYEPFLAAYDKQLKIRRGVFYTPRPVVSYIVRSVDELLRTEFGLADGLADTTTWGEMAKHYNDIKIPDKVSPDQPFVQILDPATGTGTFIVEIIDIIHNTMAAKWQSQGHSKRDIDTFWNDYVPKHLLTILYGYELLMAPYAIAHLKIALKLHETGYRFISKERVRVYLTNALEPPSGFRQMEIGMDMQALAHEAQAVNDVKLAVRFTVVVGNPPYSNYGMMNKIPFILKLLADYKRDLGEKKLNLDDDFIKFIRLAQHLLTQTGTGILGLITNNTYIDGITHRQMRRSLLDTFNKLFIIDLHGSALKKATCPDGSKDENVFDIQQGVGISLLVSRLSLNKSVCHTDVWGLRGHKYTHLTQSTCLTNGTFDLYPDKPQFFFVPKDFSGTDNYYSWPSLVDVFTVNGPGVKTERDGVSIHWKREDIQDAVNSFRSLRDTELRQMFNLGVDSRDWKVANAKADVLANRSEDLFQRILYRPFDYRHTWYSGKTRGFIGTPGYPVMRNMLNTNALGLLAMRQFEYDVAEYCYFLVTSSITECRVFISNRGIANLFPLYIYCDYDDHRELLGSVPKTNLQSVFLLNLATSLGLKCDDQQGILASLTPEGIFYYAYAVFHSPTYRNRYAEFLKIEFPRLPLSGSLNLFRSLARFGGELVALHLMESPRIKNFITRFTGKGDNSIPKKPTWKNNAVWINAFQCFEGVPENVWSFRIGGYQVCEKWLKDRKGRTLTADDIAHYQKIIVAISETIRIMKEIDEVIDKHGGWPGAFQSGKKGDE